MTYAGILVAPALIGWIVGAVGLTATLAGLIPLLVVIAWAAGVATGTEPHTVAGMEDPYDLERFVAAQDRSGVYEAALAELRNGAKIGHWMWYVVPPDRRPWSERDGPAVRHRLARRGAGVPAP